MLVSQKTYAIDVFMVGIAITVVNLSIAAACAAWNA